MCIRDSTPAPYAPGFDPKIRNVALRRSPCSSRSRNVCARTKFCSAGSSNEATSCTASSKRDTTCGNASRKNPEIRTVTSMRGLSSSSSDTTSRPVTRRDWSSHTGRTPSSANTSAMSSPAVRIADVPHTDSPTDGGHWPSFSER